MKLKLTKTLTAVFLFAIPQLGFGQTAPNLNSAADFAILAGSGISFAGSKTTIYNMDIGLSPGFLTGITGQDKLILIGGEILADDQDPEGRLTPAKQHLLDAYNDAAGALLPSVTTISGDQGGETLTPGIYKSTSSLLIQSGNLTLDAEGDETAVWIFQIASDFTTVGGSPFPSPSGGNVILIDGAKANNVYWQVGTSATIGDYTSFKGNILADQSITMNTGSSIDGRVLAINAAVTFAGGGTMYNPEEERPPLVPFSTWALVLGGVLIAGFVFFQFRRSTRLKSV